MPIPLLLKDNIGCVLGYMLGEALGEVLEEALGEAIVYILEEKKVYIYIIYIYTTISLISNIVLFA